MLHIFFIRPSDNGHYGIAEALLDQPRNDVRVRTSLFRSTQFPLTYPLPRRLDADMQGWRGLQAYHLIVLAGIDPEVLSPREMRGLVAYVEHGGGLLVVGGAVSGGKRIGTWEPLRPVLPVEFLAADDLTVNAGGRFTSTTHPAVRGLCTIESPVQATHAVSLAKGAKRLMGVADDPLLAVAEFGRGRCAFLNSYPRCGGPPADNFFTDRHYPDLVRQLSAWLVREQPAAAFRRLKAPASVEPIKALAVEAQVDAPPGALLVASLRDGSRVVGIEREKITDARVQQVDVEVPGESDLGDRLTLALEITGLDEKTLAYRAFALDLRRDVRLDLRLAGGAEALAPGMPLRVQLTTVDHRANGSPLRRSARVLDDSGATLHAWDDVPADAAGALAWTVPDLAAGEYTIEAEAREAASGQALHVVRRTFAVVDPPDNEHYFPLITEAFPGGDVCVNEADLRRMIDDAAEHGFNALYLGPVSHAEPTTNAERIRRGGERYAQERGLRLVTGGHLVPSFSRREPPRPCVFDPGFERAVAVYLGPQLEQGKLVPRLFMMEIIDEPLIAGPMVCRCERCLESFRGRFGYDMPEWDASCRPGMEAQRTDLLRFVSDYWAEIFRRCYEFKHASGVPFDVHHTFCQLSFGSFVSSYYWRDAFAWMPFCDRFDWDVYPYIYPIWRAHGPLHAPNFRHHMAGHRSLARYFNKPMGHWLDLSDRNVPHWSPPVEASSELVYTAIGQDTKLIRTFFNITFGRNNGVRRERWDDLGAELNKIGRYASVLALARKPYEPLAMLFANTDWALRHHTSPADLPAGTTVSDFPLKWDDAPMDDRYPFAGTPWNAYELLLRAFGEAALLPEPMVAAGELKRHKALAIFGAKLLSREAAEAVRRFVEDGGLLLCDGVPDKDERGEQLDTLTDLFGSEFEPVCDDLAVARKQVGRGATFLFNANISAAYTDAVAANDVRMRRAIKGTIRGFLEERGVLPHARPTNTEFEVDVLAGQDCFFVVAVNHNENADQTTVEILAPPSPVGWMCDMASGAEIPFERRGSDAAELRLRLGARRGVILGVYPERPARLELRVDAAVLAAGGTLEYGVAVAGESGHPARGHHPIEIAVTDPSGRVRQRYGGRRATTGGVYRRSIRLAINERPGPWRIEVRDPLTRTVARQTFEVQAT